MFGVSIANIEFIVLLTSKGSSVLKLTRENVAVNQMLKS